MTGMSNDRISIVVPVYNVEPYLPFCLDSVCSQSYRNLQIILVDDGSTDQCPGICDAAAAKDERIQVIHKMNGGLSDARNVGMDIADGEFITFVDSDDWLGLHFVQDLYEACIGTGADIGIGNYVRIASQPEQDKKCRKLQNDFMEEMGDPQQWITLSSKESLTACYLSQKHGMNFTTWGKLYRTSLWKNHRVTFPVGRIHEDAFTTYKLFYYSGDTVYTDEVLYYYRQTEGSIMQKPFDLSRLDGLDAAEGAWKFFLENSENDMASLAGNYYCRLYFNIYYHLKNCHVYNDQKLESFRHKMEQGIKDCELRCGLPLYKKIIYSFAVRHPADYILKKVMAK